VNQPIELSLEQQFSIRSFADQVQHMSREQAQEFLLMLYQQMMIKETMYQHFLKHEWKLDSGAIADYKKEAQGEGL
jgi:Phycobilisome degradation protein nblA